MSAAVRSDGAAAEQAADRKSAKYDQLVQTCSMFQPMAPGGSRLALLMNRLSLDRGYAPGPDSPKLQA